MKVRWIVRLSLFVLVGLLAAPPAARATDWSHTTIHGMVVDQFGMGIDGAQIEVMVHPNLSCYPSEGCTEAGGSTDANGEYWIDVDWWTFQDDEHPNIRATMSYENGYWSQETVGVSLNWGGTTSCRFS